MNILVIGGTGALGRRLIPQLIADKHVVLATSRSDHRLHTIRSLGATAITLDLLDADAVRMACAGFRPRRHRASGDITHRYSLTAPL